MIITRPDDKNVVVLSEQYYRELLKTINNLNFENKILGSALEIERGGGYTFDEVKKLVGIE
jgi:PHD/YefM family antitoxin component YafN of YafNO toxin-antitoxin module